MDGFELPYQETHKNLTSLRHNPVNKHCNMELEKLSDNYCYTRNLAT